MYRNLDKISTQRESLKALTPVTITLETLNVKKSQKYVFYLRYSNIW